MSRTRPGRLLLVFLDGVGIGPADPERNPFAQARMPRLERLLGGKRMVADDLDGEGRIASGAAVLVAADATLGVPGTPQSGTGQTALLTGRNAAQAYGRHFGPWVPTGLRDLLAAENLLSRAAAAGARPAFANAYPLADGHADPRIFRRPAAPPLAARAAGVLTRGVLELAEGRAVASSITNERWRERLGDELAEVTPGEAGRRLARIAAEADVTLFAHYDTDYVGHRGGMAGAVAALEKVDAFLGGLVDALSDDLLLILSSDHGNLEDVTAGHTLNPVPVLAVGPGREDLALIPGRLDAAVPAALRLMAIG
ncbi:MAG TPA: alkaline phosphatase family protein [Longimicrobiaceae bacterium]|nr:alkaline phosphatase family protein [Longimicrobiaceae bacterium]